ncbi:putative carbohydrate binding domain containing protein [uncultured Mediterranean phage uvMED]|nr:putative carbohydrate binding domain containing protein [uncultured Mediterranean phage uvMED]BAQ89760.1 putative carbohydrate binding domain containing protein [uncultured Mediterranean phage uvMED]BAQ89782.1 putative carbohydrate binding domain containing protein [uncultured Mediterranean phage uvMED]BAR19209.1 putative carbohydrate binding domain containing protein [uncultured Mediterranean phage uvMED]BAR19273.1 putative carbohydrate binding domain containing protein [uncultured Mediterr|tara:strand:- start:234 stop:1286 length:1053 start_codon:yes stop_codon:yes gene_type:complete
MSNARKLADNLPSVGQLSGRNMIVNGAMNVAQRSASVTGLGANATGYYTVDRWQIETGGSNSGRFTMSQSSDAPSGFGNSLKLDCTTADTSIAAGEYLLLEYHIEGQDLQRIKKGTSDAEEVTISFYVKANAAHNFVLEFYDNDNNRTCSKLFSTTTSWNRVELTYPADTTGAFENNESSSVRLFFWLHSGSNNTSGTLNSSAFNTQNSANRAAGISSFYSSTNNELYITGVQMEVGSQASPFEHEPAGVTLSKCQRYFFYYGWPETGQYHWLYPINTTNGGGYRRGTLTFPTTMRAEPTCTVTIINTSGASSGLDGGVWQSPSAANPFVNGENSGDHCYVTLFKADAEL